MKIKTIDNKGIHLTSSDGTIFSIQFGYGSYCENRDNESLLDLKKHRSFNCESSDCEVAVFNAKGEWATDNFYDTEGDQVKGYVDITEALNKALNYEKSLIKPRQI